MMQKVASGLMHSAAIALAAETGQGRIERSRATSTVYPALRYLQWKKPHFASECLGIQTAFLGGVVLRDLKDCNQKSNTC